MCQSHNVMHTIHHNVMHTIHHKAYLSDIYCGCHYLLSRILFLGLCRAAQTFKKYLWILILTFVYGEAVPAVGKSSFLSVNANSINTCTI